MARGKCAVAEFTGAGMTYQLNMVKAWNEKIEPRRIMSISGVQYTPLSAAIATGGPNVLDEIVADRKIMLVLTDGDCDAGMFATREAIKMAEARGVEVVGIGFGVTLAGRFPIYVDVPHTTALVTGGLGLLAKALEHGPAARR
jgi:nitric oxide reductase activation protein